MRNNCNKPPADWVSAGGLGFRQHRTIRGRVRQSLLLHIYLHIFRLPIRGHYKKTLREGVTTRRVFIAPVGRVDRKIC